MSVNCDDFVHPETGGTRFTMEEWERAKAAAERMRKRLVARCRHLIKGEPRAPQRANWEKINKARAEAEERLQAAQRAARGDY